MEKYIFPDGFLWGSSTSAFQVEGECTNHDFYEWALKGRIEDNTNPADAVYHYKKYKEDIALLKEMNHNTARIGIEWARIEPEEGVFDRGALEHYRDELIAMHQEGISAMVTLHHFANPLWLSRKGGWENLEAIKHFTRYAEFAVSSLGDLIDFYITINEPTVLAHQGYFEGKFPPGKKNFFLMKKVNSILADAHISVYGLIHSIHKSKGWKEPKVGIAKHMRNFDPKNPDSLLDRLSSSYASRLINHEYLNKVLKTSPLKERAGTLDFFGLNYYTGDLIKFPFKTYNRGELEKNILGWDIYPEGFYKMLMEVWNRYRLPIYVTENGTCDENDELRPDFIKQHVIAMHKAIADGADIRGYYHWSTLDNFELAEGLSKRFGLIHVDHESQDKKRTIKKSGRYYADIIKNNGILD